MSDVIEIKPIGYIKTPFPSKFGIPRQSGILNSIEGTIVFEREFRDINAFRELEKFSHIWLIWGFSHNDGKSWSPSVRPPKLGGNKRVGVFASRSPFRPNPLGLSCVQLKKIEISKNNGPILHICGADLADNTPIYDIKPYVAYSDSHPDAVSGFSVNSDDARIDVEISDDAKTDIPEAILKKFLKFLLKTHDLHIKRAATEFMHLNFLIMKSFLFMILKK